jgi:hypothetical protein
MNSKAPMNPDDIKITAEDSFGNMAAKAGIRTGLRHAQAAEEKAEQPREPSGLDMIGAEPHDPAKHGPIPSATKSC